MKKVKITIKGVPLYVTKDGKLFSYERTITRSRNGILSIKSKILKPRVNKCGYVEYRTSYLGKKINITLHRAVALCFIPNPKNLKQVNHKDSNKLNNHVDNLEWCDNSGNQIHAFANGKQKGFENHPKATLKNTDVVKIKSLITKGFTNSEIALDLNISTSKIMDIRRSKSWKNL